MISFEKHFEMETTTDIEVIRKQLVQNALPCHLVIVNVDYVLMHGSDRDNFTHFVPSSIIPKEITKIFEQETSFDSYTICDYSAPQYADSESVILWGFYKNTIQPHQHKKEDNLIDHPRIITKVWKLNVICHYYNYNPSTPYEETLPKERPIKKKKTV
jgi:hypothetical protein